MIKQNESKLNICSFLHNSAFVRYEQKHWQSFDKVEETSSNRLECDQIGVIALFTAAKTCVKSRGTSTYVKHCLDRLNKRILR